MSPLARIVLPALAAAGTTYAASCSGTTTLQNAADATGLSGCKTWSGNIVIETGASEPINIPGVQKIDGDFIATNVSGISSIGAEALTECTGEIHFDDIQTVTSLPFPKLKTVGTIFLQSLPNLQQLAWTAGVTKASSVNIQNTELSSLSGIDIETVDSFYIANNRYISDISMQLGNVSDSLIIEANNADVNVSFPNLIWAQNLTFRNCSSVDLPSLESLNSSFGMYGNAMESFAAPNLTKVGGSLTFESNTKMTNISLPELSYVGGAIRVTNDTMLREIDFPQLETVVGAVDFYGNFSSVQMDSLKDVRGAFNIQSTGDLTDSCATFKKLVSDHIKGKYLCQGSVVKPGGQGTTPSVTGSSGSKQTGAASHIDVASTAGMGFAGVLMALFGLF